SLPKTPKYKLSLAPEYTYSLANQAQMRLLASFTYTAEMFNDALNTPVLRRPSTRALDASIHYVSPSGVYDAAFGGTNLTNDRYAGHVEQHRRCPRAATGRDQTVRRAGNLRRGRGEGKPVGAVWHQRGHTPPRVRRPTQHLQQHPVDQIQGCGRHAQASRHGGHDLSRGEHPLPRIRLGGDTRVV